MNVLQISAAVSSLISLLVLLIALGSDYWAIHNEVSLGLWKTCIANSEISGCFSLGMNVAAFLHATRAFMVLAMIAGFASFFGLCAMFFNVPAGSISKVKLSAIASYVAALFIVIAMSTFTGKTVSDFSYGWSFGLGWASFLLYLITGGLAYCLNAAESA